MSQQFTPNNPLPQGAKVPEEIAVFSAEVEAEIEEHFNGKGYAVLKQELAEVCIEFLKPIQERVRGIDDDKLDEILEQGAERAEAIAQMTLNQARKSMGLIGARS